MEPLNLFQFFLLFVMGQGLFLTLILYAMKKGDRIANRLLAGAVLLMTYYTFSFFLNDTGYKWYTGTLFLSGYSIVPLIPVTFYLYLRRLATGNPLQGLFPHFIPFIVQFLCWLPHNTDGFYGTISLEIIDAYYPYSVVRVGSGVHMLLFIIYGFAISRLDFRTIPLERAGWIKKIRLLYVILTIAFTCGTLLLWTTDLTIARHVFFTFISFFIYLIGYYGYAQSDILFDVARKLRPKYQSSKLTPTRSKGIYMDLLDLMNKEKLYLKANIKLAEVAARLDITPHDLSRAINENYSGSFLDFINKYRVDEAKNILTGSERPKMFAVALDSGFGNKVSFYKNFKKFTGALPSEFVNE